ncbi:beta-xylosidase [Amycolatopsis sp. H20-H5]|uniref:beta-xylosidase n=1 Tax=Amycolatopsis sp. H20-H5 TaxID=3046309 RepID=UPI002DB9F8A8|nr:beta-xylosidase [Amycolatopsis sp. H20-H5]MEC3980987.1 beta-xylosidase [Amycolatopsis sp. H20-H5]
MRPYRRGGRRPARVLLASALAVFVLAGCSDGYAQPQAEGAGDHQSGIGGEKPPPPKPPRPVDVALGSGSARQSGGVIAAGGQDAVYNYGPSVMLDGGRTRMWWCSQYGVAQPAGDDILYAQSPSPDGPFSAAGAVFSGAPGNFDGMHTCDPSVLRVGSTYYLYYTGAAGDHALGNSVGLATSTDGEHWTRAGSGAPILNPSHDVHRDNVYGAGQPSAVYLDGWFYLMFTDTTGKAAGWNGAGQFVLRSRDPAFGSGVEAAGDHGFAAVANTASPRTRSVVDAFSSDLMWVGALDAFVIAHEVDGGTQLSFRTRDFTAQPYLPLLIPGVWKEGPGLVRRPDGHAPLSPAEPCARVPFDVVRSTAIGSAGAPTDLRRFGLDVQGLHACDSQDSLLSTLDGVAMPSPQRTMDLVTGGKLLRVDRRSVAASLAGELLGKRLPMIDRLPVAARLSAAARFVRADARGIGALIDGRLWPVPDASAAVRNDSTVDLISTQQWDAYPAGAR